MCDVARETVVETMVGIKWIFGKDPLIMCGVAKEIVMEVKKANAHEAILLPLSPITLGELICYPLLFLIETNSWNQFPIQRPNQ